MDRNWLKRGRPALLRVAVVMAVVLVALPATAYAAKATTRIVAVSMKNVIRGIPGYNPWPTTKLTATLQKKSGSRYVALKSGTVKLYKYNLATKKYDLVTSRKSSSTGGLSFPISSRGKYRFSYAGSSTAKAATAYTTVLESIGNTVSDPVITIEAIPSTTQYWVNVTYEVNWNTEAWDGPVVLYHTGEFENLDASDNITDWSVWVEFEREILEPGTVEFNYKVEGTDRLDWLWSRAGAFVHPAFDPYLVLSSRAPYHHRLLD